MVVPTLIASWRRLLLIWLVKRLSAHAVKNGSEIEHEKLSLSVIGRIGSMNGHRSEKNTGIGKNAIGQIPDGEQRLRVQRELLSYGRIALLFVLTAKSELSLGKVIPNLATWLADCHKDDDTFRNLAYTLLSRRSHMHWRYSITAANLEELTAALSQQQIPTRRATSDARVTFIMTGKGAQWFAMGRESIYTDSKFRDSSFTSDEIIEKLGASWSLFEELQLDKDASRIHQSKIAQPCVTAIWLALVDLLERLGILPCPVIGQSSGEIAAAYAAGSLSHFSALNVLFHRGFVAENYSRVSTSKGAMIAVGVGEDVAYKKISLLEQVLNGILD